VSVDPSKVTLPNFFRLLKAEDAQPVVDPDDLQFELRNRDNKLIVDDYYKMYKYVDNILMEHLDDACCSVNEFCNHESSFDRDCLVWEYIHGRYGVDVTTLPGYEQATSRIEISVRSSKIFTVGPADVWLEYTTTLASLLDSGYIEPDEECTLSDHRFKDKIAFSLNPDFSP
jgi:hypothetical protein